MTNLCRYRLFTLTLTMVAVLQVAAQEVTDFTFSHIGHDEGMFSQRVYSIVHTTDHAVWWSTKYGVDRYNGATVKSYRLGNTSVSDFGGRTIKLKLQHNNDHTETLIAFDDKGFLFEYDATLNEFRLKVELRKLLGNEALLYDVLPTKQGLWLATRDGIYLLHNNVLTTIMKGVYVNCIISTGRQLLFGTKQGLLSYHTGKSEQSAANAKGSAIGARMQVVDTDAVECGFYDTIYNKVWLGCFQGSVKTLQLNTKGFIADAAKMVAMNGTLSHPVRSICPYDDKTMLVGADGAGVWCVNRRSDAGNRHTGRLLFDANDGAHGVLHGNGIYAVLVDSWGDIIMGSYSGGIDVARPVGSTPAIFRHARGADQSLLNDRVNCVAQMADGNMVMGTDNGVSIYDRKSKQWRHLCRGVVINSFCKTPHGTLLAATYGHGVYELGMAGAHQLYTAGNGPLKDNYVYSLYYDSEGNLWMGCLEGDLVQVNTSGCKYYKLNNVHDITQLPDGRIAVGTAYGLWTVESQTGEVRQMDYRQQRDESVNLFVTTLMTNDKELWIGTDGGGVYILELKKNQTKRISSADGLPSDYISSIHRDKLGHIMIATERGLSYVSQQTTPCKVVDVNYCYGLSREYSEGAVCNLTDGNMLYGSTTGALVVNPNNIQPINYIARLKLQGVSCKEDDSEAFRKHVSHMLHDGYLKLTYDQRTFDLHFEAINLRNQYDIEYQYQVGRNGQWSTPSDQAVIRFSNLEPGKHLLRLRCVSRSSGTVLDEILFNIQIGQPWWNSWWMWLVYIGLVVLAFWCAWRIYGLHTKYMRLVVGYSELQAKTEETETPASEQTTGTLDNNNKMAVEQNNDDGGKLFVEQTTRHVLNHLTDSSFGIDDLCREMAMSRTLFYVRLKSYTGQSPQDFVRIIRLERAAAILSSGRSVSEAAALTGFDNPKYFSTVFKKYFGTSPSKYC